MAAQQARERVFRMVAILAEMQSHPRGATAGMLMQNLQITRPTLYRHLKDLRESRLPIATETVNGEMRYRLVGDAFAGPRPSEAKVRAMTLARRFLGPLEGLEALNEIDSFLMLAPKLSELPASTVEHEPAHDPKHVRLLERAKDQQHAVRLRYRNVQQRAQERVVEPVELRHHDGHLYAVTWDVAKKDWRTFKVARIQGCEEIVGQTCVHPHYDAGAVFADSVGVWSDHAAEVRIWVAPEKATLVREYPLSARARITEAQDGSLVIEDRVAGLVEVMVWVMRWGRHAEVLEPQELRALLREEHAAAADLYAGAPPRKPRRRCGR